MLLVMDGMEMIGVCTIDGTSLFCRDLMPASSLSLSDDMAVPSDAENVKPLPMATNYAVVVSPWALPSFLCIRQLVACWSSVS